MKTLKYSVIGTSWITEAFISGAQLVKELTLDLVYSRTPQRGREFAEKFGARGYVCSMGELCESDTDCVYVASPNSAHYEQCKMLLGSGKHVICEKPITTTPGEYSELRALADKNGLIYIEAIMYMYSPDRDIFKAAAGKLGRIYSANIDYSQLSSKYPALLAGKLPNIFNPELKTGALNDLGVYCVYPAIDLFGYPDKISAVSLPLFTGADGCGSAVFEYPDKLVTITYSKVGESRGVSQIIGDNGTLTAQSVSRLANISSFDTEGNRTFLAGEKEKAELMANEARALYNLVTAPEAHAAQIEDLARMSGLVARAMEEIRQKSREST